MGWGTGDSAIDVGDRSTVPITLGSKHFDHLSTPCDQGCAPEGGMNYYGFGLGHTIPQW